MTFLSLSNVTVRFGGLVAVDALDMKITLGEVRGLIGPNGSGKTTTLNAISGLYRPFSGSIKLQETELLGLKPHQVPTYGLMRTFQNLRVFPNLSVLDNILIGGHTSARMELHDLLMRPKRVLQEETDLQSRAWRITAEVGLGGQEAVMCRSLPYGMRRLVEIGRALMPSPRLVMLDEPTAGMTAEEIEHVKRIVINLKKEGVTTLVVSHDIKTIMSVCDRITVLNYGKRIAEGIPSEIQNDVTVIEAYLGTGEEDA